MRPKIGLALSGGAVRGLAHLGVLRVLGREGIPVDYVAGTSAGALVGAIYAAGGDLDGVERLVCNLNWEHLVQVVVPRLGFVRADRLLDVLRVVTRNRTFAQSKVGFACVAVDIEHGDEVVLDEGSLAEAALASASIPGIFEPRQLGERMLVDGGLLNRFPVDVTRRLGAEMVIGVDVGVEDGFVPVRSVLDVMNQTMEITLREISKYKVSAAPEVLIRPKLDGLSRFRLEDASKIIAAGQEATEASIAEIRAAAGLIVEDAGRA